MDSIAPLAAVDITGVVPSPPFSRTMPRPRVAVCGVTEETPAWQQGYQCGEAGEVITRNPYPDNTDAHDQWDAGWREAQ